jgi:hypothetical protein
MLNALRVLYLIMHLKEIILSTKTFNFIHLDPMTFKYDELASSLCFTYILLCDSTISNSKQTLI